MLGFRAAIPSDLDFVIDSWLKSFRTAHAAGVIQMHRWREVMGPELQSVIDRDGSRIEVAFQIGEEAGCELYGWIAFEQQNTPIVHYCYVKHAYRRMGIAKRLMGRAGIGLSDPFIYTFKTSVITKLRDQVPRARWNPLVARFQPKIGTHGDTNRPRTDTRQSSPIQRSRHPGRAGVERSIELQGDQTRPEPAE